MQQGKQTNEMNNTGLCQIYIAYYRIKNPIDIICLIPYIFLTTPMWKFKIIPLMPNKPSNFKVIPPDYL